MFLLDRELPQIFDAQSRFEFRAYDYGPFDASVYHEIDRLRVAGLAAMAVEPGRSLRFYSATEEGGAAAEHLNGALNHDQRDFVSRVSAFVRQLSFSDLVSAIYRAYPEMRENSIFVE